MRRAVAAAGLALALLLGGCGTSGDAERAAALATPVDDAARDVLAVLADEQVQLAPGEELDALADTQAETCDDPRQALHRTDATLELAGPPPPGLEQRIRAVVPADLRLDYAVTGSTLEVGVVGDCTDIGPVRATELSLEPRYRVRLPG